MNQTEEINSIKVAALTCQPFLENFQRKLEPYGSSLDNGRSRGWIKDSKRKVQWELMMKTHIQNFRAYLQMHTGSLNMMLSIAELSV
jgi:hypothetical protein